MGNQCLLHLPPPLSSDTLLFKCYEGTGWDFKKLHVIFTSLKRNTRGKWRQNSWDYLKKHCYKTPQWNPEKLFSLSMNWNTALPNYRLLTTHSYKVLITGLHCSNLIYMNSCNFHMNRSSYDPHFADGHTEAKDLKLPCLNSHSS